MEKILATNIEYIGRVSWGEAVRGDVVVALRALRKEHRFALHAVLTLAIGIGCSTALFSVFNRVILQALPYPHSERLVAVWSEHRDLPDFRAGLSENDILQIQEQVKAFEAVGSYRHTTGIVLHSEGEIEDLDAAFVSGEFFRTLGAGPMFGRWLLPSESNASGSGVVVMSHSLWQSRFGADLGIIGRTVRLNNKPYTVVGVMPSEFAFPEVGVQLWLPDLLAQNPRAQDSSRDRRVIARLSTGVTMTTARAQLDFVSNRIARQLAGSGFKLAFSLGSLRDERVGPVHRILTYFLASTALLLLIMCANVANLVLARNIGREREIAIRIALGASRHRILQLFVVEGLIIAILGGSAGLLVAAWGIHLARTFGPASVPRFSSTSIDGAGLLFALSVSVLSATFFGAIAALRGFRTDLCSSLKEGTSSAVGGFSTRGGHRLQSSLLVLQVGLSVVLAAGSALMLRSLFQLIRVDIGFESRNLYAVQLSPKFRDRRQLAYFRQIVEQVSKLPVIESAALTTTSPLGKFSYTTAFSADRGEGAWVMSPDVQFQSVSPGYFQTMRIPVLKGRTFSPGDSLESPCVVVMNQIAVRALWPGQDPLQKLIQLGETASGTPYYCSVVGVTANSRDIQLEIPPGPEIYFSDLQRPQVTYVLVFRIIQDSPLAVDSVLQEIREVDSSQQVRLVRMDDVINRSLAEPRFRTVLIGFFGAVALFVTAIGIYAAVTYSVSRRSHEIGIRMALGAQRRDVVFTVLRRTLLVLSLGIAIGLVGAIAAGRVLQGFLFETEASDPLSLLATLFVVISTAVLACYFPARQATRVDPNILLRCE